jgi:hypothetical protein
VAIEASTIDSGDLRVTGPNGYSQAAAFQSLDTDSNGTPRTATYAIVPPTGGVWSAADNGTYIVWMQTNQVADTQGAWVRGGRLGQFHLAVPMMFYSASMDTDPGWTLEPQWEYGTPTYSSGGPLAGFTGTRIVAYNLAGSYTKGLTTKYATTPPIDCSGSASVTLRFARWLRVKVNDPVSIQVSTNGSTWTNVWSTASPVTDTNWQTVEYILPAGMAGSPSVQLRWSLASNANYTDIGWNIDDVELLGAVSVDTAPPVPDLAVSTLTQGGSQGLACSVTYTDGTAVRLASLDSADLLVTGPNGYSNQALFVAADLPSNGSPLTASYALPAPRGTWGAADNGLYTITLREGAVDDPLNNATPTTVLGSVEVSIVTYTLQVTVNAPAWGRVTPTNTLHAIDTSVELRAIPEPYYRFEQWTGDSTGSSNPLTLLMTSNITLQAVFAEVVTTNYATPQAWLAGYGFTNDFETAATQLGSNGLAFWQSYVAGLNATNPLSRLTLTARFLQPGEACVLTWDPVPDRVYTLWSATNLLDSFTPLSGAINLPATTQAITNPVNPQIPLRFYRLGVELPGVTNTP